MAINSFDEIPGAMEFSRRLVKRESAGDPEAQAKDSSAYGKYQFLRGTYEGLRKKHPKLKLAPWPKGGTKPNQVNQWKAFKQFTLNNYKGFEKRMGRPPKHSEMYATHHFGVGGGTRLVKAWEKFKEDPTAQPINMAELVGKGARKANKYLELDSLSSWFTNVENQMAEKPTRDPLTKDLVPQQAPGAPEGAYDTLTPDQRQQDPSIEAAPLSPMMEQERTIPEGQDRILQLDEERRAQEELEGATDREVPSDGLPRIDVEATEPLSLKRKPGEPLQAYRKRIRAAKAAGAEPPSSDMPLPSQARRAQERREPPAMSGVEPPPGSVPIPGEEEPGMPVPEQVRRAQERKDRYDYKQSPDMPVPEQARRAAEAKERFDYKQDPDMPVPEQVRRKGALSNVPLEEIDLDAPGSQLLPSHLAEEGGGGGSASEGFDLDSGIFDDLKHGSSSNPEQDELMKLLRSEGATSIMFEGKNINFGE